MKMHLRESRNSKFSGGACPQTPLGSRAFGEYTCTRLLLLLTHLCKNLLKPLQLFKYITYSFHIKAFDMKRQSWSSMLKLLGSNKAIKGVLSWAIDLKKLKSYTQTFSLVQLNLLIYWSTFGFPGVFHKLVKILKS